MRFFAQNFLIKGEHNMYKNKGFTLIELMIVLAIIGVLAAIAIPAYQHYVRSSSEKSCLMELKTMLIIHFMQSMILIITPVLLCL